jgi:hypothetical protein
MGLLNLLYRVFKDFMMAHVKNSTPERLGFNAALRGQLNCRSVEAAAPVSRDLVDVQGLCRRQRRNLPEPEPRRSSRAPSIEASPSGRPSTRHV